MKPRALLAEMTREQIRAIAPETTVVLSTAAIEQHGPHLPVVTDTLACTTICQRAAELAADRTPVTVAPPLHFGFSHHHYPYPGVLSLSSGTFIQVIEEICDSLQRSGFRRIAIINGHGGNDEAIRVAARNVGLVYPVSVVAASYWTIAWPALVQEARANELGMLPGHAGAFETSLVLALRPDLVDQSSYPPPLARPPYSASASQQPTVIHAGHRLGTGPGYTDDPANGSPQHGQRFLEIISRELASFLVDFAAGVTSDE